MTDSDGSYDSCLNRQAFKLYLILRIRMQILVFTQCESPRKGRKTQRNPSCLSIYDFQLNWRQLLRGDENAARQKERGGNIPGQRPRLDPMSLSLCSLEFEDDGPHTVRAGNNVYVRVLGTESRIIVPKGECYDGLIQRVPADGEAIRHLVVDTAAMVLHIVYLAVAEEWTCRGTTTNHRIAN